MFSFHEEVEKYFKLISEEYGYIFQPVKESTMVLTGNSQAIILTWDRDGVDMDLVLKNPLGYLEQYSLAFYVIPERFKPSDWALYGNESGILQQQISSSLRVFASGLYNNCKDILGGDATWLKKLKDKDPAKWKSQRVNPKWLSAIKI